MGGLLHLRDRVYGKDRSNSGHEGGAFFSTYSSNPSSWLQKRTRSKVMMPSSNTQPQSQSQPQTALNSVHTDQQVHTKLRRQFTSMRSLELPLCPSLALVSQQPLSSAPQIMAHRHDAMQMLGMPKRTLTIVKYKPILCTY